MRAVGVPGGWLWIAGVLAPAAAAVSLWFGAARASGRARRGYRWLAAAAVLWCAGAAGQQVMSGQTAGFVTPLTFADLFPLLALAPAVTGIAVLAGPARAGHDGSRGQDLGAGRVAGQALDGYVMASALLVMGWLTMFGNAYDRSGADPRTFVLGLARPLAGIVATSVLLPWAAAAGRRAALPYVALAAITLGESFGAVVRLSGSRGPGGAEELAKIAGYLLLVVVPWWRWSRPRAPRAAAGRPVPASAIVSALATVAAALLIAGSDLTGRTRLDTVAVVAACGAAAALAVRVLGLARSAGAALTAARAAGRHVRELADRTSDAVLICDLGGTVLYASPSVAAYGYAAGSVVGRNLADFAHPEDRPAGARGIRSVSGLDGAAEDAGHGGPVRQGHEDGGHDSGAHDSGNETAARGGRVRQGRPAVDVTGDGSGQSLRRSFSCRILAADGTWRAVECTVSRYEQPGERSQLLVTARDLSGQTALRQQLAHVTFHDRVTGLPNRAFFEERVADVLSRRRDGAAADQRAGHRGTGGEHRAAERGGAARERRPAEGHQAAARHDAAPAAGPQVAAIFLHLGGLTAVKDPAGHTAGDLLLAQAARRLRSAVSPRHTMARWAGAEFAVLVESRSGAKEAVDLAGQLARCIADEPFTVSGRDVSITASAGVAVAGHDGSAGEVLRNAEAATSQARASGDGRVEIFAGDVHTDMVRRLELTSDLRSAIAGRRLSLEFQPVVELATGRVTGAEAMAGWWRGGERVPRPEFLALAEESGLAVPLGGWVLGEACRQLARWRHDAGEVEVHVNVSLRQIGDPGFVPSVIAALAGAGLAASALTVQVAEHVLVAGCGEAAARLSELRGHGCRIAVDDVGAGYASLGSLRHLPVDVIKIDPSFVSGLGGDDTLTLLTRAIVRLGEDLGVTVVAKGVQSPRQLELLEQMGCACGQGRLLAGPVPAGQAESLIAGRGGRGPQTPAPDGMEPPERGSSGLPEQNGPEPAQRRGPDPARRPEPGVPEQGKERAPAT